jgi:hypothetical protein
MSGETKMESKGDFKTFAAGVEGAGAEARRDFKEESAASSVEPDTSGISMSERFVCRATFNRFFLQFIKELSENFPECEFLKNDFLPTVEAIATNRDDKECEAFWLFRNSLRPFVARMKKRDDTLAMEPKCEVFAHMELSVIFHQLAEDIASDDAEAKQAALEAKSEIWRQINAGYILIEIFDVVPPESVRIVEGLLREYQHKLKVSNVFDKERFKQAAIEVLYSLDEDYIDRMYTYFFDFIGSANTPVYDLLDEKFHDLASQVFKRFETDEGKSLLFSKITPMVEQVTKQIGPTTLTNFARDDGKNKLSESERKEKMRIIMGVLDVVIEALDKNRNIMTEVMQNPRAVIITMVRTAFLPLILKFAAGDKFDGTPVEEKPKSRLERMHEAGERRQEAAAAAHAAAQAQAQAASAGAGAPSQQSQQQHQQSQEPRGEFKKMA